MRAVLVLVAAAELFQPAVPAQKHASTAAKPRPPHAIPVSFEGHNTPLAAWTLSGFVFGIVALRLGSAGHTALAVEGKLTRRSSFGVLAALAAPPLAASAAQDNTDLTRLKKGLEGINYLLDNWDKETVDPITGADSPDRCRFYLGIRTTDHPLFQVEKLITKAQGKVDDDDFESWVAASEGFTSAVAKVNELAYTSSFGEYNPGGGKEQVRKYLLLAKEQVVETKTSLEAMIKILKI
jgi:Ca2+ transporting ATPase